MFANDWCGVVSQNNEGVDVFGPKIMVWEACQASGLECTRFVCGYAIFPDSWRSIQEHSITMALTST